MLCGFSHHHDNPGTDGQARAADYRVLTDYMDGSQVMKKIGGARVRVDRGPVPEILYGSAEILRRQIAALPFQRKYRFGLLSFEKSDVDVEAFNAGNLRLRRELDLALVLFFEALWPGIPAAARPMPYVTTHTHTARVEINVALPRAVYVGARAFSHNPYPPTPMGAASDYWRAFRDLLNLTFGWADPEDPLRRLNFARPHWETKLLAEGTRAGLSPPPHDLRAKALEAVRDAVQAGEVFSRQDVLTVLESRPAHEGWKVLSTTNKTVTIGAPDTPAKERLRLKGHYFAADFDGRPDMSDPETMLRKRDKRLAELATAPARFQSAWAQRSAYNRSRYSRDEWPEPTWTVESWADLDRAALPTLIPYRHHMMMALSQTTVEKDLDRNDTITTGSAIPELYGPDQAGAAGSDPGPNPQAGSCRGPEPRFGGPNRRSGRNERSRRYQLEQLERHARAISGPIGPATVIGHLIRRLRDLTIRAGIALAGSWLAHVITPDRVERFSHLATHLETLNVTHDTHPAADGRVDAGYRDALSGNHTAGGHPAINGQRGSRPAAADGRGTGPDCRSTGSASEAAGKAVDLPFGAEARHGQRGGCNAIPRPAPDRGIRKARSTDRDHGRTDPAFGRSGLSLGVLLTLGRDLARTLGADRVARLSRIDGGVELRTRGVGLVLFDDRMRLVHWTRSADQYQTVVDHVSLILGDAFRIEDMRTVLARRTTRPADKLLDSAGDKIVPEAEEPQYQQDTEDQASTPAPPVDDDFGPGF